MNIQKNENAENWIKFIFEIKSAVEQISDKKFNLY
jgi:hypothetical protein